MRQLLVTILTGVNWLMRTVTSWTHFAQYSLQWGFEPRPEWFDHYLDQHWQWSATNNGLWVERGVFSHLVLKDKSPESSI